LKALRDAVGLFYLAQCGAPFAPLALLAVAVGQSFHEGDKVANFVVTERRRIAALAVKGSVRHIDVDAVRGWKIVIDTCLAVA
jgi:hypothetical protein